MTEERSKKFILGNQIIDMLFQKGLADKTTQRVVIDIPANGIPIVYTQSLGTESILDVVLRCTEISIEVGSKILLTDKKESKE